MGITWPAGLHRPGAERLWVLSRTSAPASEPVTLTELKLHVRVDDTADDALLTALGTAARESIEQQSMLAAVSQAWALVGDGFPWTDDEAIELWKFPVDSDSITITYIDADGLEQTWDSSNYRVLAPAGLVARPTRILPAPGVCYPCTQGRLDAVTVTFSCGYADAAAVPESVKAAIKLLVGHWYANREGVNVGNLVTVLPLAVDALLAPYMAEKLA